MIKELIIKLLTRGMNYREKRDLVKLIIGENTYEKMTWQINVSSVSAKLASDYMNSGVIIPEWKFKELCDKGIFDSCDQLMMIGQTEWHRDELIRSSKNLEHLYFQS